MRGGRKGKQSGSDPQKSKNDQWVKVGSKFENVDRNYFLEARLSIKDNLSIWKDKDNSEI